MIDITVKCSDLPTDLLLSVSAVPSAGDYLVVETGSVTTPLRVERVTHRFELMRATEIIVTVSPSNMIEAMEAIAHE